MSKFLIFNFQFSIAAVVICFLLIAMPVRGETSEEGAVYRVTGGNSPVQTIPEKVEGNILQNILSALGKLKDNLLGEFFFIKPQEPEKTFAQSEFLQQTNVPPELVSKDGDAAEQLKDDLGGATGFYGQSLPDELPKDGIGKSECLYEQSRFPEGVNPVTEGSGCK